MDLVYLALIAVLAIGTAGYLLLCEWLVERR